MRMTLVEKTDRTTRDSALEIMAKEWNDLPVVLQEMPKYKLKLTLKTKPLPSTAFYSDLTIATRLL